MPKILDQQNGISGKSAGSISISGIGLDNPILIVRKIPFKKIEILRKPAQS